MFFRRFRTQKKERNPSLWSTSIEIEKGKIHDDKRDTTDMLPDNKSQSESNARAGSDKRRDTRRDTRASKFNSTTTIYEMTSSLEDLDAVFHRLKTSYRKGKTKSLEYRQLQLRQLAAMLEENRKTWKEALHKDMGRCEFEAELCEIVPVVAEAVTAHNDLKEWTKPEKVKTTSLNAMDTAFIQRDPLGLVLIIATWNYPIQYTLRPLVGAIAAGNVVIVKISTKARETADVFATLFNRYLDPDCYAVVVGDADLTGALLLRRFDFVFFTGKTETGQEVAKAAAETLTPVSLHMGGKNPVYVDNNLDAEKVSRCILWGKMMNAGQSCVAPDYVLCRKEFYPKLLEGMKKVLGIFYGPDPKKSPSFGRIVDLEEWQRIVDLIETDKVAVGGQSDPKELYIAPTILTNVTPQSPSMQSEIYGPILPILQIDSEKDALHFIKARPTPLAVYVFSKDNEVITRFHENAPSGGFCGNDVLSHLSVITLPNGGLGASGMGGPYHGQHTFQLFTHPKSVLIKKLAMEGTLSPRYPPYTPGHLALAKSALKKKFKGAPKGGGDDSD